VNSSTRNGLAQVKRLSAPTRCTSDRRRLCTASSRILAHTCATYCVRPYRARRQASDGEGRQVISTYRPTRLSDLDSTESNGIDRARSSRSAARANHQLHQHETAAEAILQTIVPIARNTLACARRATIDPIGMATTRARKLEVGDRILRTSSSRIRARAPGYLIYDTSLHALATGDSSNGRLASRERSTGIRPHQARTAGRSSEPSACRT